MAALLGGLFLLGGAMLFLAEVRDTEKHTAHLAFAFGAAVFGAGMLSPDAVFDRLKRMAGLGARFLGKTPRESTDIHVPRGD